MKKLGSNAEFKAERNSAILDAYRAAISQSATIDIDRVMDQVVRSPSPRFWVSEERATVVVSQLIRGAVSLSDMTDGRARMYAEILARVRSARESGCKGTLVSVVRDIVYSSAPEFYITPHHAYNIICNQKKHA